MDFRDKRFWIPTLVAIPIGILINLATQWLAPQYSCVIVVASLLVVGYLLLSDRIANSMAERSRQSRAKAARQLEQEIDRLEKLRGDLPRLVSQIAWDLLQFQVTMFVVGASFAALIVAFLPIGVDIRPYAVGTLMGLVVGMLMQVRELRYIRRVSNFDVYRDEARAKLAKLAEPDWLKLLLSRRWILVHNPPNQSKTIIFLQGGKVGEGQNQNEHTWRVQNERLELLQEDGRVHSRFDFDKTTSRFIHTNDPDTLSGRNQVIHLS